MPKILLAPSYGNRTAQRHFDTTIADLVQFQSERHIERPKQELLSLEGFSPKDPLTGQRLVRSECVPRVLRAFNISTSVAEAMLEATIAETLERRSRVIPVEGVHKNKFTRTTATSVSTAHRVESALVLEYQNFCDSHRLQSFVTSSGRRADLYRDDVEGVEVIEAKSLASHEKLREAVAQLLDYAPHSPKPVTRLTGLFPQSPDQEGMAFLHRLGIDVVYFDGETFIRSPAPDARRRYMVPVWRDT
ncbi:hypothetical protein BBK82_01220 [Lentzea guizhouensis]|uniref:Uncharacterized protein n=1 Tax=Lentzea guizhouensis TaxID=1586287 RepID=A0A1B2HB20_9PSEU|nr:hypothetical protein [Lentzea guizhouensis]ANZ34903.1 hypothetical protein BBK82_01220 [Lentzea guizhouensis]